MRTEPETACTERKEAVGWVSVGGSNHRKISKVFQDVGRLFGAVNVDRCLVLKTRLHLRVAVSSNPRMIASSAIIHTVARDLSIHLAPTRSALEAVERIYRRQQYDCASIHSPNLRGRCEFYTNAKPHNHFHHLRHWFYCARSTTHITLHVFFSITAAHTCYPRSVPNSRRTERTPGGIRSTPEVEVGPPGIAPVELRERKRERGKDRAGKEDQGERFI